MSKKILINATQKEELRVALVNGAKLFDLDIETRGKEQKIANVYKATITRIEPSLEAAFVDYGTGRHGFLPFREIASEYINSPEPIDFSKQSIKDYLFEGQELIIQIDKEERGSKGAALTTFLSLAGCYMVLMPNNPRAGGISRRIEGEERADLRDILSNLNVPEGMGVIIRTAGVGRKIEDLQWDLNVLLSYWKAIQAAAEEKLAPFLIYQEGNAFIRAIRDHLKPNVSEVIVDDKEVYNKVYDHLKMVRPEYLDKLKLYQHKTPLFNRYQIESQIETVFKREIQLPLGGAIVIDHTEALISIDVNSAKATQGLDIEETAYKTNLEAADEIARQLRIRDLGGLVVIDFIDMAANRNQRSVENTLRDALSIDRAKVQIGRISRFGLLEMSRQRLKPTIAESNQINCPRCKGQGSIHSIETLAVMVSRVIEEESIKENTVKIQVEAPIDLATYLINEKRGIINGIEERHNIIVIIIPNSNMQTPEYNVTRIKQDENAQSTLGKSASYKLIAPKTDITQKLSYPRNQEVQETAAVQPNTLDIPSPPPATASSKENLTEFEKVNKEIAKVDKRKAKSILKRIWNSLVGEEDEENPSKPDDARVISNSKGRREYGNSRYSNRGYKPSSRSSGNRTQQQRHGYRHRQDNRHSSKSRNQQQHHSYGNDRPEGNENNNDRQHRHSSDNRQQGRRNSSANRHHQGHGNSNYRGERKHNHRGKQQNHGNLEHKSNQQANYRKNQSQNKDDDKPIEINLS